MNLPKFQQPAAKRALLVAGMLALLAPIYAQACASCGCTLSSDWENLGVSGGTGFKFDLRYDSLDQDQLRSGTGTISPKSASQIVTANGNEEVEKYTNNHYLTAALDYSAGPDWGLTVQLPYIIRGHSTLGTNSDGTNAGANGGQYDSHTSDVGDMKIIGRYQGFTERHNLGLLFGIKLPTGSHTETGNSTDSTVLGPVAIDRGLQPGTGTTDLVLGAFVTDKINEHWDYFAQGTVQDALDLRDGYKPGRGVNLNAGLRYSGFDHVTPLLQVNARYVVHDTGVNADTLNTGGTLVYLSPGAIVPVNKSVSVYGFMQTPFYQDVRGVQLAPRYSASIGTRLSF